MTPRELVPVRYRPAGPEATTLLLEHLSALRAAGAVPLVGDDRWSTRQWDGIDELCAASPAPAETGWATLTSGSSGFPRIVLRSASSWSASFERFAELVGMHDGDALALPAPPAASISLFSLAHALEGGPHPLLPSGHATSAGDFADATLFHGTPQALARLLDEEAPPRLRAALVGGSRLDPALRERAADRGIQVVSYYGAAELSVVAVDTGSGYLPFPGVDVDVRDGLLWVRSLYVANGYLSHPAGHAGPGPLRTVDGWHTVGDRAELVGDRLVFGGRADGAILTASATVVPEDVESALRLVPGVGDAVVLGIPAPGIGKLVAAVIEPATGTAWPDAAGLRRAAGELLSPAHRPRRWFTTTLPRTASGKPARAEIARRLAAGEVAALGR
ncbi:AMP-binding protein [Arthrobacter sp. JSM 101049]|uniref:AMP-binding protein n=1 Tax=Arthrobacter sp. JSM 101049 TaxID=929097 RepID=UPI0035673362